MTSTLTPIVLLVLLLAVLPATAQETTPRLRVTLNDGWRYADGPLEGAEAPAFDDAAWTPVHLPHTWNAADAFDKTEGYRRGVGWYRKRLALDPALQGKRLFLYFEGANQVADVFVNGAHAGRHVGGYTAFVFDVTGLVAFDAPNTVAVRVDNRHDDDIPPLDADFTFYGGLYRDVWLIATEPVHLDVLDHASPGVFIDTPEVSAEAATVRVRGTVVNDTDASQHVEVVHRILDGEGMEVAVLRSELDLAPEAKASFEAVSEPIATPHLWSPETPYLYRVVTEVRAGGRRVDVLTNPLGVRRVAVRGDGFYLNGARYRLVGSNRHQDAPRLGNALPDGLHRRDVHLVKETGFNFLRLAHYPQDPAVLAATDRAGLAVWEEIPVVNTITMSEAFTEHAERMLVEMIRQHYNHPSIVIWGLTNEVLLRKPNPLPDGYLAATRRLVERLNTLAHREDPSRPTALAVSNGEVYDGSGVSEIADILGMNLYFGWYYGEFADFGAFLDSLHTAHPDRPLFVSEYGAGSDERVHARQPVAFDFSTEHMQNYHRASFDQIRARPYLAGTAVWNHFDFGSSHRQDTKNSINQKGLYFFDRTPKDIAYYYQALQKDTPVLHIEREHAYRAGMTPADRVQPVQVFTNAERVQLLRNGAPAGAGAPENGRIVFDVPLEPGPNEIAATGAWGSEARTDRTTIHYDDRAACLDASTACVLAYNIGSPHSFVDPAGLVYLPDPAVLHDDLGAGGRTGRTHHRIYRSDEDPRFQSYRETGTGEQLTFPPLPPGDYEVRLGFIEPTEAAPGERVFTVRLNGLPVVYGLDLAAEAGRWTAVERTIRLHLPETAPLTLDLVPTAGTPILSSLVIRRF